MNHPCICRQCGVSFFIRQSDVKHGRGVFCAQPCRAAWLRANPRGKTHGHANGNGSPTYVVWLAIKARCLNPKNPGFKNYGGRGIRVCDRWMVFENFLADMGERPPGTSIDRIDNDCGYEPGNCRWATPIEQGQNTRRCRMSSLDRAQAVWLVEDGGFSLAATARAFGVTVPAVSAPVRRFRADPRVMSAWLAGRAA